MRKVPKKRKSVKKEACTKILQEGKKEVSVGIFDQLSSKIGRFCENVIFAKVSISDNYNLLVSIDIFAVKIIV